MSRDAYALRDALVIQAHSLDSRHWPAIESRLADTDICGLRLNAERTR